MGDDCIPEGRMIDGSRRGARGAAWRAPLLAIIVATPVPGWSAAPPPGGAATRPEDRVIFEREAARKWMSGRSDTGELWTPALADVTALEAKLPAYLRASYKDQSKEPLWKRAPGYKRQYFGITYQGARVIYANFFCDAPASWRTVLVDVDDGGDCYFSVKYDAKRGTFQDLMVNGEA
jgi:hypothetical protein